MVLLSDPLMASPSHGETLDKMGNGAFTRAE